VKNFNEKRENIIQVIRLRKVILLVDNGSKHLNDIINFLRKKNALIVKVDPLKFNLRKLKREVINGVILSGGNTLRFFQKKEFNFSVIRLFRKKPLLGICLGHEFLIDFYGGGLYKMDWRAQGLSYIHITKDNSLIRGRRNLLVYKGHSYAAGILPDCFEQLAWSTDCENEMIEHRKYPHFGVQFHPEKTKDGHIILSNFLKLC